MKRSLSLAEQNALAEILFLDLLMGWEDGHAWKNSAALADAFPTRPELGDHPIGMRSELASGEGNEDADEARP